jgi:transcriptional regulator with XRE-family HTH domain
MNIIGKNIQQLRERKQITQEQPAIRLTTLGWQVDRFLISKIERGERQVTDIQVTLLADALQVKLKDLFGRE